MKVFRVLDQSVSQRPLPLKFLNNKRFNDERVGNAWILRNTMVVVSDDCQSLCVSGNDGHSFVAQVADRKDWSSLQCLALYCSLMVFGWQDGRLDVFRLPSSSAMSEVDLSRPVWSEYLSEDPIESLAIGYDAQSRPVVVAGMWNHFFVVRWDI